MIEAVCEAWNQEDEDIAAVWNELDRLDLNTDPFVMGRQAVIIEAGCPYRVGSPAYARFKQGSDLQRCLM
jgi:hypothetical protein